MVLPTDKERKTFSLSKEVTTALRKHIALQVATGTRETAYGAESETVEEALRIKLGLHIEEKEDEHE